MSDSTPALQQAIIDACSKKDNANGVAIDLRKGDYTVQTLEIPRNSKVMLFSKDRVRILYVGKRNRPLFVLQDNSMLVLKDKLEIYYNTNNMQEVMRLMIRMPPSGKVEISKDVKISLFSLKQQ